METKEQRPTYSTQHQTASTRRELYPFHHIQSWPLQRSTALLGMLLTTKQNTSNLSCRSTNRRRTSPRSCSTTKKPRTDLLRLPASGGELSFQPSSPVTVLNSTYPESQRPTSAPRLRKMSLSRTSPAKKPGTRWIATASRSTYTAVQRKTLSMMIRSRRNTIPRPSSC